MSRIVHAAAALALIALAAASLAALAFKSPVQAAEAPAGGCKAIICMVAIN